MQLGKEGGRQKSHKDHNERIAMTLLPRKGDAPQGKPRNKDSLFKVMQKHLKENSAVVADKWTVTPTAENDARSKMRVTCNHSNHWRNPENGIHSNDVESEFAHVKLFLQVKYEKSTKIPKNHCRTNWAGTWSSLVNRVALAERTSCHNGAP